MSYTRKPVTKKQAQDFLDMLVDYAPKYGDNFVPGISEDAARSLNHENMRALVKGALIEIVQLLD